MQQEESLQSLREIVFFKRSFIYLFIILAVAVPEVALPAAFSLDDHWRHPIPPQGTPPAYYSEEEASIQPEGCGTCHSEQYEGWKGSRHAAAMGPGLSGQLHKPWLEGDGEIACLQCHAPLSEQSSMIVKTGSLVKNDAFIPSLRLKGITCAACHVRGNRRYGPKRRGESPGEPVTNPPHGGFTEAGFFSESEFCRPCHQFDEGDNRVAGKLLQNTFEEWRASAYPKKGVSCQTCHMPGRAHLWRGIHDPEMVKKGIDIGAELKEESIYIVITNSGTGHNFPSYVTPKVTLRGVVIDKDGNEIDGSDDEANIGWYVSLDLSKEYYDNRIPPGESFSGEFDWKGVKGGEKVLITLYVYPDDFYRRFFKAIIKDPPKGIDVQEIRRAYEETKHSGFEIYRKEFEL